MPNKLSRRIAKRKKVKARNRFLLRVLGFLSLSLLILISPLVPFGARAEGPEPWSGNSAGAFAGGTGTESDPFLISNGEELAYFSAQVNAGNTYEGQYIVLTGDILLNGMKEDGTFVSGSLKQFTPIGSAARPFKGIFDGRGFKIIGLYIDKNWLPYQGLFGYAGTGSEIADLKLAGSIAGGDKTGSVAGYTNGLVAGCEANCPVTANGRHYHGGIAGEAGAGSVISNCTVWGNVEGSQYVGGVAGYTEGKIVGCSSVSALTGVTKVGGIAGYAVGTASEISGCHFFGTAKGNSDCIGGIAGQSEGLITGCRLEAVAVIEGSSGTIGGVTGYAAGAANVISNCTVLGTVKATGGYGFVGGVAGKTEGTITGCVCECDVTAAGQHYVGGVVGDAATGSEISNSSSSGDVTGTGKVGGIAGYSDGEIKICINTGDVNGGGSGHAGGVCGQAGSNADVNNSFNAGAVSGGGQGYIGGIIGNVDPGATVHHNLNKGTVEGNQWVGSLFGNKPGEDNAWNNYYEDYDGAPGGSGTNIHDSGDIGDDDGAIPVGDLTWEEIWELLNEDNQDEDGNDIWNQDMDDEGVPKPGGEGGGARFKIVSSKIKEGKFYAVDQLAGAGTEAVMTSDSVFTVFFEVLDETPSNPKQQTLRFNDTAEGDVPFPADTSIIMWAEGAYYYLNLVEETAVVKLGDFVKMGSTDLSESYNPGQVEESREYLFFVDLSKPEVQIPAGTYNIKLTNPNGKCSGVVPALEITGQKSYALSVNSSAADTFAVSFNETGTPGYDHKTAGNVLAFEFYLEKELENEERERILWPIGTKIKRAGGAIAFVSSDRPSVFLPVDAEQATIFLDLSECAVPLEPGDYTLQARAYGCTDFLNPRGGYLLAEARADIALSGPAAYAIGTQAQERFFDQSAEPISVPFQIQTLGSNIVKAALQCKYGRAYVEAPGSQPQTITITGGQATLSLPGGSPKGTYRFLLVLEDENGMEKARTVENIIIK